MIAHLIYFIIISFNLVLTTYYKRKTSQLLREIKKYKQQDATDKLKTYYNNKKKLFKYIQELQAYGFGDDNIKNIIKQIEGE